MSNMKRVIIIGLAILLSALFTTKWEKSYERAGECIQLSETLKSKIKADTKGYTDTQIIEYSLNLTAEQLRFAKENNIANHKANCVGYARFCSSICNYAFSSNNSVTKARPVVGHIKIFGINIHPLAQFLLPHLKNFVADHDYVQCGSKYFDPSIYDVSFGLLGRNCQIYGKLYYVRNI